jgi:hypothetical protein
MSQLGDMDLVLKNSSEFRMTTIRRSLYHSLMATIKKIRHHIILSTTHPTFAMNYSAMSAATNADCNGTRSELQSFDCQLMHGDVNFDELSMDCHAFDDNSIDMHRADHQGFHNEKCCQDGYAGTTELSSDYDRADAMLRDMKAAAYNTSQYEDDLLFQFAISDSSIFLREGEETKFEEADYDDDEISICDSIRVTFRRNLKATKE